MASWQSHLLSAMLRVQVKRKMRGHSNVHQVRASLDRIKHKIPPGVLGQARRVGGVDGEWLVPVGAAPGRTLLYLHGGGYFACSARTHRPITTGFARRGLQVFAPEYRLAPEHPFPAAIDDAVAAYEGLLAAGIGAEQIVMAGDSAGGGLAMAALLTLREAGRPLPAGAVLFSPWTDLAATGASIVSNHKRDAMFNGDQIGLAAAPYLAGTDPLHPRASPVYAALHGLPPLLIHVGSHEVLLDDSTRLAERALAAGTPAILRQWPVVPHVWQLFGFLPEARVSMDLAAEFLLTATRQNP
jgi:monoterpene epsilon-lactone hydrolase